MPTCAVDVREQIIAEARSWLGVPFRHHGRTRLGVDCVGLLVCVFGAVIGIREGCLSYGMRPTSEFAFSQIRKFATRITPSEAGPGDVVQMNYDGRSVHFGILSEVGIIHSTIKTRAVVEHALESSTINGQIVAYYRINGVEPWRS